MNYQTYFIDGQKSIRIEGNLIAKSSDKIHIGTNGTLTRVKIMPDDDSGTITAYIKEGFQPR